MTPRHDTHDIPEQPVIDRLLASRERVIGATTLSAASPRRLAALADDAVRELAASAEPPAPWAVIALGGYGAGRLLPASDLDLLIVCDAPAAKIKPLAEAVFYPLWDSGLKVGHQVRSRRGHLSACRGDLATLTASLTGRVLAGDSGLGERLLADVAVRAFKDRRALLPALASRPRPGSPYLLEPDLKEGRGGRRDLDELVWTAAIRSGRPAVSPQPLVPLGLLSAEEAAALDAAEEVLTIARWHLHTVAARPAELLDLDSAEELPLPPYALARALATVAHTLDRVRRRVAGVREPQPLTSAEALFTALDGGAGSLPLLEEAAWAGDLDTLVPGLAEVMPLRRPGLAHTLTVGAHCLAAAALVADTPRPDPFAAAVLAGDAQRRLVQAAALVHDFGKREPGAGHAGRAEDGARSVAASLGMPEAADDLATLVREHLLLPETTTHADPGDEDALLRAAARLGKRDLVAPLYVLTLADTRATSPGMWTPWLAAVTGELAARLDAALSPDVEGAGIALAAERTREAALALLRPHEERQRAFVEGAPLRYLASTSAETVALHADLAAPVVSASDPAAAAVGVSPGPLDRTWRVTVATRDRAGLFAMLAGVFALCGLSILSADALPGPSATAIDVFVVESATLAAVDTATWSQFDRLLRAALAGHLDLEVRLEERARHYRARASRVRPRVSSRPAEGCCTTIRVEAADRVGLLHDLAHVLADAGLDLRSATVLTHDARVSDTFRVVDAAGDAPAEPAFLAALEKRLAEAARR